MVEGNPLRSIGRRMSEPVETVAQAVAEQVIKVLVDSVDVNRIIQRIDLDQVISRVDVNQVLDRIDVDRLLGRLDVQAVLDRVDPDEVVQRIDLNRVVQAIDVNVLVQHTELGPLLIKSTTGVAAATTDGLRSLTVALDLLVDRAVSKVLRRKKPLPIRPAPATAERALS